MLFLALLQAAAEQGMRQRRYQGDRYNQRSNQREYHRQGEWQEQLADHTADERKRQEDGNGNDGRGQNRYEHFTRSRADQLSAAQLLSGQRHAPVDILDYNDGVIDDAADGDGHGPKRHHVKGNIHLAQAQNGDEQR
ncbi:hypothetical protein D3C73_948020 [compost metagenome]